MKTRWRSILGRKYIYALNSGTLIISPDGIRARISERSKAIVVVHLSGQPAPMDGILQVAREHNLKVIEDCAQAFNCYYKGKIVGSLGDVACFSLQQSKHITAGEGGFVVTDDPEIYKRVVLYSNAGMPSSKERATLNQEIIMKPISVQLYSVREAAAEDFIGAIKQIADIGYQGVETAGLHGHSPAEIRKVLDDLGMTCSSAHGPLATPQNVNEIVDTAKALGYSMVIAGKGPDDFKTLDGIKAAAGEFQSAAELLKPHGLQVGYHNHWWEFDEIDGRLGYEIFLELAPNVFSEMDTYWANNFGKVDVPAMVAKHAARLPILHIKDGPLIEGQPHTAVGAGKMDIPAVIDAADPNVLEWLVVELDECATDMMQAVRESYQYLNKC